MHTFFLNQHYAFLEVSDWFQPPKRGPKSAQNPPKRHNAIEPCLKKRGLITQCNHFTLSYLGSFFIKVSNVLCWFSKVSIHLVHPKIDRDLNMIFEKLFKMLKGKLFYVSNVTVVLIFHIWISQIVKNWLVLEKKSNGQILINQFATFLSNKSVLYLFLVIDDSSITFLGSI